MEKEIENEQEFLRNVADLYRDGFDSMMELGALFGEEAKRIDESIFSKIIAAAEEEKDIKGLLRRLVCEMGLPDVTSRYYTLFLFEFQAICVLSRCTGGAIASEGEQALEAVCRMMAMGVDYETMRRFAIRGELSYSDRGIVCELVEDDGGKALEVARRFEERTGNLVYHVSSGRPIVPGCVDLFYVEKEKGKWDPGMIERLRMGEAYIYSENTICPEYSEFGPIAFSTELGGVSRLG